ncbi:MAG: MBL fold metallo-hydrolase [Candidatus Rokuibacteriota bacterium]|nr:MAG: MBL fold metallo-hydrolase [Candidatus Rokubacteria bacterium]
MRRSFLVALICILAAGTAPVWSQGQPAQRPMFATTKVDGTDNVYVFRYGNHQSMFVVTSDGVIATDPIGYGRPQAVKTYVDEIKKVSDKPIKYLVYSHHHFDHIAGGQPFKDAGAVIVAHKKAKEHLIVLKDPATVLPDETMDKKRTIKLGGTVLELSYVGLNHSDSTIVMRLPKEKILFAVDFIPVGSVPGRGMLDFYPLDVEDSFKQVLAMDWDRMIPGHPGPGDRLGTKKDAQDQLAFLQDASEAVKAVAREGKCWEPAEKELKLPKYESWPGYENNLPFVIRRYCALWGRGF